MHLNSNSVSTLSSRPQPLIYSVGKKVPVNNAGPSIASSEPTNASSAPPATAALTIAEAEPLTLEGLKRAWGTDDPRYDFNRDGSVNMRDMLQFLAGSTGGSGAADPPSVIEASVTDPAASTSGAEADATNENPAQITIDGLMEVWGKADDRYDFNRDGTVNMPDLLELMTKLSAGGGEAPPTSPVVVQKSIGVTASVDAEPLSVDASKEAPVGAADPAGGEEPAEPLTVEGLLAAWGKTEGQYDLNSDGMVNMHDLLSLLSSLQGEPAKEAPVTSVASFSAEAPASFSPVDPSGGEEEASTPLSLKGLLELWGRRSDQYDVNGDNVVGMQDLLAFLRSSAEDGAGGSPAAQVSQASSMASSIMEELKSAGFGTQPPVNIHQLIGNLDIESSLQKQLLDHLSKEYPSGLGVNMVG